MQRRTRRIIAAVAVIALLAAGGAAFTDSIVGNPVSNGTTAGYGTISITGATLTDVNYTLSANGTNITEVNFTFQGNLEGDTLELAFDNANLAQCSHTGITNGVIPTGAYNGTSSTAVTCDVTEGTTAATSLQAAVTNN